MSEEEIGGGEDLGTIKPVKKSGGGLPIIPIVIAVVVLAVIGGVGYFVVMPMLSGGDESAEEAEAQQNKQPVATASNEGIYDPENKPGLIEFNEPVLVKLRKTTGSGMLEPDTYLQFTISLEVATPEIQTEMVADPVVMSRLQDTINVFFGRQFPKGVDVLNWSLIKEQLMEALNEQFPPEYHIKRVNFLKFLVQSK